MRTIQPKPLTAESFRRYGQFMNLLDDAALAAASVFPRSFFADVIPLDFGHDLQPTVSVNSLKREDKAAVRFIEMHHHTCEGILPLDTDVVLFVGLPEMGKLSVKYIEAFIVPKGTFVRLDPLIIHGSVFCTEKIGHSLCLLAGRTFANDMEAKLLGEDEQFELAL